MSEESGSQPQQASDAPLVDWPTETDSRAHRWGSAIAAFVAMLVLTCVAALVTALAIGLSYYSDAPGSEVTDANRLQLVLGVGIVSLSGLSLATRLAWHRIRPSSAQRPELPTTSATERAPHGGASDGMDPDRIYLAQRATFVSRMTESGRRPRSRVVAMLDRLETEGPTHGLERGSPEFWQEAERQARAIGRTLTI